MIVMVVVIVGMRVRSPVVCMLMRVRCPGSRRVGMGMIVVPVVVGVLVSMCDCIVRVSVRMVGHRCLLVFSRAEWGIEGL